MISTGEFSLNSWLKFAVASIAVLSKLKLNATETTELNRSIGQDLRRLSKTLCSKQHKTYIDATMRVFKFQGGKTLFVKLNKIISRRSLFFKLTWYCRYKLTALSVSNLRAVRNNKAVEVPTGLNPFSERSLLTSRKKMAIACDRRRKKQDILF